MLVDGIEGAAAGAVGCHRVLFPRLVLQLELSRDCALLRRHAGRAGAQVESAQSSRKAGSWGAHLAVHRLELHHELGLGLRVGLHLRVVDEVLAAVCIWRELPRQRHLDALNDCLRRRAGPAAT